MARVHSSPFALWHHRVLGGVWAVCGLVVIGNITIGNMAREGKWSEYEQWIVLLVATAYVVTAVGFILNRRWARRTMWLLMVVAVVLFLDMLLLAGWAGNHALLRQMETALGLAGYTLLFLAISALNQSKA